jgi:hypothetical protein
MGHVVLSFKCLSVQNIDAGSLVIGLVAVLGWWLIFIIV